MPYLKKTIAPGIDFGLTHGEVIVPVRHVSMLDDATIAAAIRGLAADHEMLQDLLGAGTTADTLEQALQEVAAQKQRQRSNEVKRGLVSLRRKEFAAERTHLVLALINRDGYVCQAAGCRVQDKLTIDHILPLSRGGSDELSNLRFLCFSHNSKKGDKVQPSVPPDVPASAASPPQPDRG